MPSFQKNLLQDVYWAFSEPTPSSPEDLVEAARQYAADIDCPDPTRVLSAKLPFSDVKLSYTHWVRDESGEWEEREAHLRVVGPGGSLTGAELLWELHVACAATVGETITTSSKDLNFRMQAAKTLRRSTKWSSAASPAPTAAQ